MSRKLALLAALVLAAAITAGVAIRAGGGGEKPLTGAALQQATATAAALAHTRGGTVTETETGDDGAAYSVEVRLADGSQVEIDLDSSCEVIGQEQEDDGPNDDDEDANE
jgi:archaellin